MRMEEISLMISTSQVTRRSFLRTAAVGGAALAAAEHGTEREKVGASVDYLAARLFGRHVGDRSHDRPRNGEAFVANRSCRYVLKRHTNGLRRGHGPPAPQFPGLYLGCCR
jgi:hypothetical protein